MATTTWAKGMKVTEVAGSAIGQNRTGVIAWIGRSKGGRLRIGVKTTFHKLIYFTPGDYNEWLPIDKEAI